MGQRAVTKKGSERRPKNWNPEHGEAFLTGKNRIYSNDTAFFEEIGWDVGSSPSFKRSNEIHIDTTKIKSDTWNVNAARSLAGTVPVQYRTQERRIPGGSAFNGIWSGISLQVNFQSFLR